ncbi:MAG TPA: hypothetical protein VLQ79_10615 [Myxococcaceae bacterium]|nr:hypothetical protein [Myxococcaceae bacterium]
MLWPTVLLLSLSAAAPSDDVGAATRVWEEARLKRLTSDDGWLTLVGLGWLVRHLPAAAEAEPAGAPGGRRGEAAGALRAGVHPCGAGPILG